ncbi:MFS transporter [Streptomyces sp. NPDC003393]
MTLLAFSTVPSPLYAVYAARDGFSPFMITLIYAAYAAGVIFSMLFISHLSDFHGRRPHVLAAIAIAILSDLVFLTWPTLSGLFVGRVLCGVAVGLVTSTAAAALRELHQTRRPSSSGQTPALVVSLANMGGLGLGALMTGVLAEYVGQPLTVPYWVVLAALVVAAVVVYATPETRPRRPVGGYRSQRLTVPDHARGEFAAALLGIFLTFAALGMFIGLAGTFLIATLHTTSVALAGATVFTVFGAGVVLLLLTRRWGVRRMLVTGVAFLVPGLVTLVVAAWMPTPSLAVFLAGGAVVGIAGTALFKGTLGTVTTISAPESLGETLAGFFLSGYIGLTVPVVALGIALQFVSPRVALLAFAILLATGLIASCPVLLSRRTARIAS